MTLHELKTTNGAAAWPPVGGAAAVMARERGLLFDVDVLEGRAVGLVLTMDLDGQQHTGVITWEGPPARDDLVATLRAAIGRPIRELGGLRLT
jgi:hypothetical protein